uniref:Uncharacterized protein n=1 Tax=Anguilla anguilla TaxID=7936 RepID=A0A0E9PLB0_ANGAN
MLNNIGTVNYKHFLFLFLMFHFYFTFL